MGSVIRQMVSKSKYGAPMTPKPKQAQQKKEREKQLRKREESVAECDAELRRSTERLEAELASMEAEWEAIGTTFSGPSPMVPSEQIEWSEATLLDLTLQDDSVVSFQVAWHRTVSRIKQFFGVRFLPWAVAVERTLGSCVDTAEMEGPPLHGLPLNCRGTATSADWLTGTTDTAQAGLRIIVWTAASADSDALNRSQDFDSAFFSWLCQCAEFRGDDDTNARPNLITGRCNAPVELMSWVRKGFVELRERNVLKDGPVPPDKFRFAGTTYGSLGPKPYWLIYVLWNASNRTATKEEIAEKVWGDPNVELDQNDLGSARKQANKFFRDQSIPYKVEISPGCQFASLVDTNVLDESISTAGSHS